MSIIETHNTRWDWETILNVGLNVALNDSQNHIKRAIGLKLFVLDSLIFKLWKIYASMHLESFMSPNNDISWLASVIFGTLSSPYLEKDTMHRNALASLKVVQYVIISF